MVMEKSFLETGEGKLRYQTRGSPNQNPLILLNGIFMTLDRWELFSKNLSKDFFVIVHDMRCQGGSFCPDRINLYDHVNDIVSLMDELGVQEASVAGTSYGGEVAQLLTLEHSDRVKDLSLITTTSEIPVEMYYMALRWKMGAKTRNPKEFTLSFINDVYSDEFIRENPDILEKITTRLEETDFNYRGAVKLLNAFTEIKENAITPKLDKIGVPTQVVSASKDRVKPPEVGKKIHNEIKGSTYNEVKGSGHGLVIEKPKELLKLLKSHLN